MAEKTETPILDERAVSEIEARANAATEGPWGPRQRNPDCQVVVNPSIGVEGEVIANCRKGDDTWFIAHAREDIPALCATVKHLRASDQHSYDLWLALKERHQHRFTDGVCAQCGISSLEDHDGTDCIAHLQSQLEQLRAESDYWRTRATEASKAAEKWYHERY